METLMFFPSLSTSTSVGLSAGQNYTTENKIQIQGENPNKKMNRNYSSYFSEEAQAEMKADAGSSQGQGSTVNLQEAWIHDLPPEMLTTILKCVDTRSLFNCRLVNQNWSAISSRILRHRSEAQICFQKADYLPKTKLLKRRNSYRFGRGKKTLNDFLRCMKKSKNCPFAHFAFPATDRFSAATPFFDYKHVTKFLSDFSLPNQNQNPHQNQKQKINGLELSALSVQDFPAFQNHLKNLLLCQIPHLVEFSLELHNYNPLPIPNQIDPEFQLPRLKVLRFKSDIISSYRQIARDLLIAAVNLKTLYVMTNKSADFQFLHSLGKLDLLKGATVEINRDFVYEILQQQQQQNRRTAFLPLPKLDILELDFKTIGSLILVSDFLVNFFESSKNTLTTLNFHSQTFGLGHLPKLELPIFKNLKKLSLRLFTHKGWIFPPGIRERNIFPAVEVLDLNKEFFTGNLPSQDSIPVFPSLKTLTITEQNWTADVIHKLALMCPNLKTFKIQPSSDYARPELNFPRVGRSIWTHMKQLESLEVKINVDLAENNPAALDSCFTGISVENFPRLSELMEVKREREKWGFCGWIPEAEAELKSLRHHPSVLDMKYLKKLTINSYRGSLKFHRKEFLTQNLTWISHDYAFNLMLHLTVTKEDTRLGLFSFFKLSGGIQ